MKKYLEYVTQQTGKEVKLCPKLFFAKSYNWNVNLKLFESQKWSRCDSFCSPPFFCLFPCSWPCWHPEGSEISHTTWRCKEDLWPLSGPTFKHWWRCGLQDFKASSDQRPHEAIISRYLYCTFLLREGGSRRGLAMNDQNLMPLWPVLFW